MVCALSVIFKRYSEIPILRMRKGVLVLGLGLSGVLPPPPQQATSFLPNLPHHDPPFPHQFPPLTNIPPLPFPLPPTASKPPTMPPPTPSPYVTLISSDGFEFIVSRDAAYVAGTIRKMLDPTSNFAEAASGRCFFETIKCVFFPFAYPVVEAVEVMLCKGAKGNANWRRVQTVR